MRLRRILLPLLTALTLSAAPAPQPKPVYRWKDDQGKVQITNTPPPPGAEVLDAPPPPMALESDRSGRLVMRQSAGPARRKPEDLSPAQRAAWEELDKHLEEARKRGDKHVLEAVASSLLHDSLWGSGLGWVALIPFLTVALLALLGWWFSFGLPAPTRKPVLAGFAVAGLLSAQMLVGHFLYRPQFYRVRLNINLFTTYYLGGPRQLTAQERDRLNRHFLALEDAAGAFNAPWRFYSEVDDLEDTLKKVVTAS